MIWLLAALTAHVANAIVFTIDKGIVGTRTTVGNPWWYAAASGGVAAGAGVLLVVDFVPPTAFMVWWALAAGLCWVTALVLFFIGLQAGEASRVVPIAGSSVPVCTLLLTMGVLGERVQPLQLVAMGLLILGGLLLSLHLTGTRQLSRRAIAAAVASGAAFAAYFVIIDFVYSHVSSFWAAFAYARLGVGVVAGGLVGVLLLAGVSRRRQSKKVTITRQVAVAFMASKGVGMAGLVLQHYAINVGSVSFVNALQGVQYLFLLLLAWFLSRYWPRLYHEEFGRLAVGQKSMGIVAVSVGLLLLTV